MRVCVTGAAGFLGRHVCRALKEAGHYVICLDIPTSEPLPELTLFSCADFIAADITKPLAPIPGLDAVIHLAAVAAPRDCDADPAKAFNVNVNGTHQVLKMALESGAKKVVFSSSAHVYDIPPRYMPTDEVHPLRLNNTYTTTKLLGEQLCHLYYENHGLSYTTLRLYNAYGPGQARGYFIPDKLAAAKAGSVELSGGNTTKDFVYIDDVARAFLLALQTSFVGSVNIGTGVETTLEKVATIIARGMGVNWYVSPSANGTRMQADRTRAKRVLGWEPTTTIEEGLRATIDLAKVAHPIPA